jgi:hypothetical protein
MSVSCPSCQSAVDAGSLNPAAQTGVCGQCGDVRPLVELSPGRVEGWLFTSRREGEGGGVVAHYEAPQAPVLIGIGFGLCLIAIGVFGLRGSPVGARFLCALLGVVDTFVLTLLLRPTELRLSRERFELSTPFRLSARALRPDDVFGFTVETREGSDLDMFAVVARVGARHRRVTVFSSPHRRKAQSVSDRLNEALFLVMAQSPRAPYR